jgi:hypothetical protein
MKVYLIKQNHKTIDFLLLEADDKFVRKSWGKVDKLGIGNSTLNSGSPDKAIVEIDRQVEEYKKLGFVITDLPTNLVNKDIVFDKAKWHVNDQFPKDLDQYQSYVHAGLYIAWLIDKDFLETDFKTDNKDAIQKHLTRQTTPVKFYELQLDGVFDAEGLTQEAIKFTADYFDFEKGNYVKDYLATLDPLDSLPSFFHITDSWENYDTLKLVLNRRLTEWRQTQ